MYVDGAAALDGDGTDEPVTHAWCQQDRRDECGEPESGGLSPQLRSEVLLVMGAAQGGWRRFS
jgi:hypothetical protein